ncbi:hypothetical protein MHBO_000194 [Bonamia ostreae]|uniref:RING-type E3 ubiquitin transferase n=1 Tax=Bonamia ostreae TaxID=126728 RepID=A0ABV2AER8_9EUKA
MDSEIKNNDEKSISDTSVEKTKENERKQKKSLFDCFICFEEAAEPVTTLCGHLFCWSCIHTWIANKNTCPVCKASVTEENIIPLYDRGRASDKTEATPKRPKPKRIEPPQQRGTNNPFNPFGLQNVQTNGVSFSFGVFPFVLSASI